MIRLYHGSNIKIETPDLIHSKPFKDFGRGFYLSPNKQQALFVLANRDKQQAHPIHDYDIVYGPIADDGVAYQLRRYVGGVISLPRLVEELKYAKGITFQYYFGIERALQLLQNL